MNSCEGGDGGRAADKIMSEDQRKVKRLTLGRSAEAVIRGVEA